MTGAHIFSSVIKPFLVQFHKDPVLHDLLKKYAEQNEYSDAEISCLDGRGCIFVSFHDGGLDTIPKAYLKLQQENSNWKIIGEYTLKQ